MDNFEINDFNEDEKDALLSNLDEKYNKLYKIVVKNITKSLQKIKANYRLFT